MNKAYVERDRELATMTNRIKKYEDDVTVMDCENPLKPCPFCGGEAYVGNWIMSI